MRQRRSRLRDILGTFLAAWLLAGCQTGSPERSEPPYQPDDFGEAGPEDVSTEAIQREEMLLQRAQIELRTGVSIPFDIFRPDEDPLTDPGLRLGTKAAFEAAKNLFFGLAFDWTGHEVDDPPVALGPEQIQKIDSYDKYNILFTVDYDIPLYEDENPLLFRFGAGAGVTIEKFEERPAQLENIDTFVGFIFRPHVGLRYHIADNWLVFTEASYEWVPERSLETNTGAKVSGEQPVFSAGTFWLGFAYEWE